MSGINSVTGRADISQVLAEMRNLRSQIKPAEDLKPEVSPTRIDSVNKPNEVPKFSELLSSAVNGVNEAQKASSAMKTAYEQGDPNVSITQVMIQSQKASVAFDAVTQVRNKVVKAYEDIMKMPV
ncbi:flagellar hook-basal body protein FliE [Oleiphilus sp. HI0071]|jgi:flagellar hook-basal body complex protein FliE|uniref:flagellar hook-basal body complex protein FliE n=1 Tax=unclassified Oleiphilus TaxID=2631174 RepID=UPI0007C26266|nr:MULTISPECIES: flagellar hook-basal body complex protein FliE [unclassified Oleiphilus]KZY59078.1 flagellar hook-basal body protein FliE [Oleiphilus sp. HI0065]KZY83978.1 flagellar hook-basal body protein FliE [Oleiphilus sp. HI0071]KZY91083.1 flagellar hook-basal body protein FliE [Oleiphilus sp. HI0073]KZZ42106.1 flagellar hook-basal body protein FliE [Oleiphilus sp. HI0118]KZZ60447.1 flagellar hook-basal body protein FliE [Oleiphilus sp. HI0122]KZZ70921.1 flagellar hook-basal body protei